ncbi:DUF481 domain-containing protein [Rhodocytophaga rosea]|uniref:DUF481 domain-containing protein n=1 Tax=Rhodocytophaga rosea TaxID=2704465 RepID=A0A6C0GDN1_9BACT|nr:DUF481 domain-containing protein [Rhodocytophaga rosea]QHT66066.1 DUF481 domain-containing protein [Rhodocytophaga rosea]
MFTPAYLRRIIPSSRQFYGLCISFLICFSASGQILNIEKDRIDSDTANVWLGNIGLTFNTRSQQVQVLTFNAFSNVVYLSRKHSYIFISNNNLIRIKGQDVISDGYGHFRIHFLRRKKLSAETFAQAQYDESRGMHERELAGAGIRYHIHHSDQLNLAAGLGAMYEHERWALEGNDSTTSVVKSTNYFSLHWKISKHAEFNFINYYQARFSAFFHPRIISDASLIISINRHFAFTTRFVATYDALPVIPVNKYVYSLTNGLVFRF